MHSRRSLHRPLTRRDLLSRTAGGFGALAFASLLAEGAAASSPASGSESSSPFAPAAPHHRPKARSVIFLYMDGGVSQVDSFDPKERLAKEHGEPFKAKIEPTQFDNIGKTLASPWGFRRYGESGLPVSDLFPHVGRHADKLCVVRSMVSEFSEHQLANFFLHTGFGQQGRPCMGAWFGYGLGTENHDLPSFVVINGGLIPSGGLDNFGAGFLPASYQGTLFRPGEKPIANVSPREVDPSTRKRKRDLLRALDARVAETYGRVDGVESAIANYEMAFRMQQAVPDLADVSSESESTRRLYGLESGNEPTRIFGTQCLLARRMVERGVRFIELTCPHTGNDRWDAHSNLRKNHTDNALAVDQPIAGLLADLDERGLLDETLVVWTGEFGRTPFAQGQNGRDHSPFGFSTWLAGGGVKGGHVHGETDEFGYKVVRGKVDIHDLHATMLWLLGMDHERLTFRFAGRDMRLTDVHGRIVDDLIA